jgi:hypothetical protein
MPTFQDLSEIGTQKARSSFTFPESGLYSHVLAERQNAPNGIPEPWRSFCYSSALRSVAMRAQSNGIPRPLPVVLPMREHTGRFAEQQYFERGFEPFFVLIWWPAAFANEQTVVVGAQQ